jgi:predicted  nucleic acid-binding Zn-ribbon protein
MSAQLPTVLREAHRLRRHLRELGEEIDRLPRTLKAHQAKVAKQEQALKEFLDGVKHLKVDLHDKETRLKAAGQQLAKYERQLSDMTTPKEVEARQTEIANTRTLIAGLEEQILAGMGDLDDRTAKAPEHEGLLKKAKADLATFAAESKERQDRLAREKKQAEEELTKIEAQIPDDVRGQYDRLVNAYGADALAAVKGRSCGQCRSAVTSQNLHELLAGKFLCCGTCGRALYLAE